MSPSVLSEALAELRTALGLLHGVFPRASKEDADALLRSVAEHGVQVAIVVDEHGIIDGYARVAAVEQLAWIVDAVAALPEWTEIAGVAETDRRHAVETYGKQVVESVERLADYGADLVGLALEHRWDDPPVERPHGLDLEQRRQLAVSLNAHRRHLTRGELRQVIEMELMIDPARTNVAIAGLVGCTPQWVGQIRQQLVDDEALLANPQADGETKVLSVPFKPVAELSCPHCAHELLLSRAGRDFSLALT